MNGVDSSGVVSLAAVGLPPREGLEGHSLVQQLKDAGAPREWPAITTANQGNHAVRSERWRYIRYADGSEELYDRRADPDDARVTRVRLTRLGRRLMQQLSETELPRLRELHLRNLELLSE